MQGSDRNGSGDSRQMTVASVNVGAATTISHRGRDFLTGIDKQPSSTRVRVLASGVEGDAICDLEHHGGVDQAVYVYGQNHYRWWSEQLGRDLRPGLFGENLSIQNLPDDLKAGDRFTIGELVLEATAPRIPCSTFAAQMRDSGFGMAFRRAEKPGFYFRVIVSGDIGAGDTIELHPAGTESNVSMLELFRLHYDLSPDPKALQRALESPIAERLQRRFEQKLDAAEG